MKTIAPDRILYEDDVLLIVNKLGGELSVAGADDARGQVGKKSKESLNNPKPALR
jgi:23S rRNA-/tRNA-specific pseudouridylate synthase